MEGMEAGRSNERRLIVTYLYSEWGLALYFGEWNDIPW